jgi:ariadne-1
MTDGEAVDMEDVQLITPRVTGEASLNLGLEGRVQRSISYTSLEITGMEKMQRDMIEAVSTKLAITASAAGVLLRGYRWNDRALLAAYRESPVEVCKKACVGASLHSVMRSASQVETADFECPVCFDDVPVSKSFAMNCGHRQCLDCWLAFLENEIDSGTSSGGSCLTTTCPGFKCKESVGEEIFEMLLPGDHFEKYQRKLLLSFVDDNDDIQWCPR